MALTLIEKWCTVGVCVTQVALQFCGAFESETNSQTKALRLTMNSEEVTNVSVSFKDTELDQAMLQRLFQQRDELLDKEWRITINKQNDSSALQITRNYKMAWGLYSLLSQFGIAPEKIRFFYAQGLSDRPGDMKSNQSIYVAYYPTVDSNPLIFIEKNRSVELAKDVSSIRPIFSLDVKQMASRTEFHLNQI